MKAVYVEGYGPLEGVKYGSLREPRVRAADVLVRVHASSINPVDWKVGLGKQRMLTGHRMPRVLGMDVAGEVVSIGSRVTHFREGDRVFGIAGLFLGRHGSFAELAAIPHEILGKLPDELSYEQGATLPVAGLTAWALRHAKPNANTVVFVNGASGGVGSFTVPMAKLFGAKVVANCSDANREYVLSLGADEVVDYQAEDPRARAPYDVFFDARGNINRRWRSYLKSRGWFFSTEPSALNFLRTGITYFHSAFGCKTFRLILTNPKTAELEAFARFVLEHRIAIPIVRTIGLSDVPAALQENTRGHARGKTVVRVV